MRSDIDIFIARVGDPDRAERGRAWIGGDSPGAPWRSSLANRGEPHRHIRGTASPKTAMTPPAVGAANRQAASRGSPKVANGFAKDRDESRWGSPRFAGRGD
jgi:hypothetical protein